MTDLGSVERALAGCEVAYNLAKPRRASTARVHQAVNCAGTEHVLRAARTAGVRRVVHCSSAGVHGRLQRLPATEEAPFDPQSTYQASKAEAERIVLEHVRAGGISAVIARPTAVYGPGDLRNVKLFRSVLAGRLITIGAASHPYHMTYVDDVVQGLRRCAGAEVEAGGVELRQRSLPAAPFTLTSALLGRLLRPLGMDPPLGKTIHFFTVPRSFDISKAKRELGFRPQISLEDGVRRTLAWYVGEGRVRAPGRHARASPSGADA